MATGGDIREATDNHPTLGSFVYQVKVAEDNNYDTGGYETTDDANMKSGDNQAIWQINGKMGFFQLTIVNDMTKKVAERLKQLAAHPLPSVWTFGIINNITYQGLGKPVGSINPNVNTSTIPVKIAGPEFKQI